MGIFGSDIFDPPAQELTPEEDEALLYYGQRQGPDFTPPPPPEPVYEPPLPLLEGIPQRPEPDIGVLGLPTQPIETLTPEDQEALLFYGQPQFGGREPGPELTIGPSPYADSWQQAQARIDAAPDWARSALQRQLDQRRQAARLGFEEQIGTILSPELLTAARGPETPTAAALPYVQDVAGFLGRETLKAVAPPFFGIREAAGRFGEAAGRTIAPQTEAELFGELLLPGVGAGPGLVSAARRAGPEIARGIAGSATRFGDELAARTVGRDLALGPELALGRGAGGTGGGAIIGQGDWIRDPVTGIRGQVTGEGIVGKNPGIDSWRIDTGGGKVGAIPKDQAELWAKAEPGATQRAGEVSGPSPAAKGVLTPPEPAAPPPSAGGAAPPPAVADLPATATPRFIRQALADAGLDNTGTIGQVSQRYRLLRERGVPQPERIPESQPAVPSTAGEVGPRPPAEPQTPTDIEGLKRQLAAVLRGEGPSEVLSPETIQRNVREGGAVEGGMQTPRNVLDEFRRDPAFVQRGRLVAALEHIGVTPGRGTKAELANQLDHVLEAQAPGRAMEAQKAIGGGGLRPPEIPAEQRPGVFPPTPRPPRVPIWQGATDQPLPSTLPGSPVVKEIEQQIAEAVAERQAVRAGWQPPSRPPKPPTAVPGGGGLLDEIRGAIGAPVALKSSLSPPALRQGMTRLVTNPKQWARELGISLKVAFNEEGARAVDNALRRNRWISNDPETYGFVSRHAGFTATESGLKLRNWGPHATAEEREALFQGYQDMSRISRRVEVVSRPSERQMAVELNLHGANRYAEVAQRMWDAGNRDVDAYRALASVINHQQHYGGWSQGRIPVFFSTRAVSGRVQTITDFVDAVMHPADILKPGAAQEAVKGVVGVVAADMAVVGILSQVEGVEINWSSGLPTIKVGPHHFDPWAGWNSIAKTVVGIGKDIYRAGPADVSKWDAKTWDNLAQSSLVRTSEFARKSLGPIPGQLAAIGLQVDFKGEPYGISQAYRDLKSGKLASDLMAPFIAEQIVDAYKQDGLRGVALTTAPGFLSTGVSSYTTPFEQREQALANLPFAQIYPPEIAALLPNVPFDDYGPKERQVALDWYKQNDPANAARIEALLRTRGSVFQQHRDVVAANVAAAKPELDNLYGALFQGSADNVKAALERADDLSNQMRSGIRNTAEYKEAVAKLPENDLNKLLDTWHLLPQYAKTNGVTDWDKVEAAQRAFVAEVAATDPVMAQRLEYNAQAGEAPHKLLQLVRDVSAASQAYYALPEGRARQLYLAQHPELNELRWLLGYNGLYSQQAIDIARTDAPKRTDIKISQVR